MRGTLMLIAPRTKRVRKIITSFVAVSYLSVATFGPPSVEAMPKVVGWKEFWNLVQQLVNQGKTVKDAIQGAADIIASPPKPVRPNPSPPSGGVFFWIPIPFQFWKYIDPSDPTNNMACLPTSDPAVIFCPGGDSLIACAGNPVTGAISCDTIDSGTGGTSGAGDTAGPGGSMS